MAETKIEITIDGEKFCPAHPWNFSIFGVIDAIQNSDFSKQFGCGSVEINTEMLGISKSSALHALERIDQGCLPSIVGYGITKFGELYKALVITLESMILFDFLLLDTGKWVEYGFRERTTSGMLINYLLRRKLMLEKDKNGNYILNILARLMRDNALLKEQFVWMINNYIYNNRDSFHENFHYNFLYFTTKFGLQREFEETIFTLVKRNEEDKEFLARYELPSVGDYSFTVLPDRKELKPTCKVINGVVKNLTDYDRRFLRFISSLTLYINIAK